MGSNSLSQVGTSSVLAVGTQIDQYFNALQGVFYPRDSSGVVNDGDSDFGATGNHWRNAYFGDGTNITLFVDSVNGNVGIGTASPSVKLDIQETGSTNSQLGISQTGTGDAQLVLDASDGDFVGGDYFSIKHDNSGIGVIDLLNGTSHLVLQESGGNVGIGTASPLGLLELSDGYYRTGQSTNTTQENILLRGYGYRVGSTIYGDVSVRSDYNGAGNYGSLEFYTSSGPANTTKRMTISAGGNVGIGTASPSYLLDVSTANSGATNTMAITNTSNTASSGAESAIVVAGASGGDPVLYWRVQGTNTFYAGIDNSDSDTWKLSTSSDLSSESINVNATTGIVSHPLNPRCVVELTADETTPSVINWDATIYDNQNMHDGSDASIDIVETGNYLVNAYIRFVPSTGSFSSGDTFTVTIVMRVSGAITEQWRQDVQLSATSSAVNVSCMAAYYCDNTYTWEVATASSSSATVHVDGGSNLSKFSVHKIS